MTIFTSICWKITHQKLLPPLTGANELTSKGYFMYLFLHNIMQWPVFINPATRETHFNKMSFQIQILSYTWIILEKLFMEFTSTWPRRQKSSTQLFQCKDVAKMKIIQPLIVWTPLWVRILSSYGGMPSVEHSWNLLWSPQGCRGWPSHYQENSAADEAGTRRRLPVTMGVVQW